MGCEGIRGRTGARAWEVIHIYTGSFTPLPGPHPPFYRRLISTRKGGFDNQRDTPPNTRLTVQPIRATSVAVGMIPHEVQVLTESAQLLTLIIGHDLGVVVDRRGDLRLQVAHHTQPLVPAAFELPGNQTILGIGKVILALRTLCLIPRLLKTELSLPALRRRSRFHPLCRVSRRPLRPVAILLPGPLPRPLAPAATLRCWCRHCPRG